MYTSRHYKPFSSGMTIQKSRSTDNFYLKAAERSLKYQTTSRNNENDCLACKHEQHSKVGNTTHQRFGFGQAKTQKKIANEEYYKTNEKDELTQLRISKRYLEQMVERTKVDFKKSSSQYEVKVTALSEELREKSEALFQLQKQQNQKDAEQYYLANTSLVQTYQQNGQKNEANDEFRAKKMKELVRKNNILSEELESLQIVASERQNRLQILEIEVVKMRQFEMYAKQYDSMRLLIEKMEEEKFSLLNHQHTQLQELQFRNKDEALLQEAKIEELTTIIIEKTQQISLKQDEQQLSNRKFERYKDEQYETLRELLDQRQKECSQLQSRLNCIESELTFVKGRYGYILKLHQNNELMESRVNQQEQFCIERVDRYQMSNGKESLMGMDLSPIKRR